MDPIWELVQAWQKLEAEAEGLRAERASVLDGLAGDEALLEDIMSGIDGTEWGSGLYTTKLQKMIAQKKLRLAELDNLIFLREKTIEETRSQIAAINREIMNRIPK